MSKRMQVLIENGEYERLQEVARMRGLTLAEWVRGVLRAACREEPGGSAGTKIDAIRAAARHEFPVADLDRMLEEIESGYLEEKRP